ncbi:hypothetical protein, variant, partial [Puccinia triticina 1-1 BBBD Race 1]
MNSRTPLRPVIQLLGSPPHLIFQLVRLTTLPYMIYQIINNNNKQNEQPLEQQIDQLEHSPQLSPQAVDQLFLINRAAILNTLRPQHHHPQPHTPTSTAWQAEAMAQIVQHWTTLKQQQHHHPATSSISKSRKIHSHIRAFLANGPPQCHCQRSQLPLKTIHLGLHQVGTLQSSATLGRFASKLNHALSPLTILRLVDLARHAQRWDLAVIFLDRSLAEPAITSDPRLANRRSGQVTALLHFLRRHQPPPEPELDPLKLWAIHFICQSIESRIISPPHPQWAPINRLSLDVLTRYASMPIGFDRRLKKHQKTTPQTYPCLDLTRHRILLDAINQSTSELEFAVLTRERCERLLSKLTRLTIQQPASSQPWTRRSALQLRLLEYLARQGTHQQFTTLLHTHLHQHPSTPKLARTILLAAPRPGGRPAPGHRLPPPPPPAPRHPPGQPRDLSRQPAHRARPSDGHLHPPPLPLLPTPLPLPGTLPLGNHQPRRTQAQSHQARPPHPRQTQAPPQRHPSHQDRPPGHHPLPRHPPPPNHPLH